MGLIATALTVVNYAFFATKESVFWSIFALSSIVLLLPYLLMFPALLVLRRKQPDRPRPYRVPGGAADAWVSVVLSLAGIHFAIVLFFYLVPEGTPKTTYWIVTGGGTALTILVGWWLSRRGGRATWPPAAIDSILRQAMQLLEAQDLDELVIAAHADDLRAPEAVEGAAQRLGHAAETRGKLTLARGQLHHAR